MPRTFSALGTTFTLVHSCSHTRGLQLFKHVSGLTNLLSFAFSTSNHFSTFLLSTFSLSAVLTICYVFPYFPQISYNSKTSMYLHMHLIIQIWAFIQFCEKALQHKCNHTNVYTSERSFCLYTSSHGERSASKDFTPALLKIKK